MTTETIDRLFLELSQFTTAETETELALKRRLEVARDALWKCDEFVRGLEQTDETKKLIALINDGLSDE